MSVQALAPALGQRARALLIDCGECWQVEHKDSLLAGKALAETELKRTQVELAEEQQKRRTLEDEKASVEEQGLCCRACIGGLWHISCVSCMDGHGGGRMRRMWSCLASVRAVCVGRLACG